MAKAEQPPYYFEGFELLPATAKLRLKNLHEEIVRLKARITDRKRRLGLSTPPAPSLSREAVLDLRDQRVARCSPSTHVKAIWTYPDSDRYWVGLWNRHDPTDGSGLLTLIPNFQASPKSPERLHAKGIYAGEMSPADWRGSGFQDLMTSCDKASETEWAAALAYLPGAVRKDVSAKREKKEAEPGPAKPAKPRKPAKPKAPVAADEEWAEL
ncbi:hypothetical protein Dxin01_00094 [Deinococcus xinjiangensis]|uniref:Uncharacterized protein n=1 Tax=Deinococcus xinjiangensis TaxID=457454 RepID=A0ABP9V8R1_9DEIO